MASFESFLQKDGAIQELKDYLQLVDQENYPETANIKRIKEIVSKSDNVQKEQYHNQSA
jgi:hypothetical protein